MGKDIIKGEECRKLLREGINDLADTVTITMGPNGKTVIISDGNGHPYITKDGVSVTKQITFSNNEVKNIAAALIKEVAIKTVEEAGDGTTTAICLARAFINKGFDILDNEIIKYPEIKLELELLEKYILDNLKNNSRKLNIESVKDVATIAANNDKDIGDLIQEAYNNSKIVKVEESNKENDELITIKGMQLNTGFFDKAFINNPAKQSIEYTNIPLLVIDGHLNDLKNLEGFIKRHPQGIAIIADHFSDNVVSILKSNFNVGALNIALIKSPGFATHRKDLMKDIALFTSGSVIDPNKSLVNVNIGLIDYIKVTNNKTIIGKEFIPTPEVLMLVEELKKGLKELEKPHQELLQQRIDNLSGSLSIIKVGGKSEVEMKERKDRVDDAVLAVSCALEEGIIEGGGKALQLVSSTINNNFTECLCMPKITIIENGAKIDYSKDFFKEGIIDPYKVTRVALQNAISVAKTILSTEAVIINNRLWA